MAWAHDPVAPVTNARSKPLRHWIRWLRLAVGIRSWLQAALNGSHSQGEKHLGYQPVSCGEGIDSQCLGHFEAGSLKK